MLTRGREEAENCQTRTSSWAIGSAAEARQRLGSASCLGSSSQGDPVRWGCRSSVRMRITRSLITEVRQKQPWNARGTTASVGCDLRREGHLVTTHQYTTSILSYVLGPWIVGMLQCANAKRHWSPGFGGLPIRYRIVLYLSRSFESVECILYSHSDYGYGFSLYTRLHMYLYRTQSRESGSITLPIELAAAQRCARPRGVRYIGTL